MAKKCDLCNGSGKVTLPAFQLAGNIVDEQTIDCSACRGTGDHGGFKKLPVVITKGQDDPQGIPRISIGGNDVFGAYIVYRGDEEKIEALLKKAYLEFIKYSYNKKHEKSKLDGDKSI